MIKSNQSAFWSFKMTLLLLIINQAKRLDLSLNEFGWNNHWENLGSNLLVDKFQWEIFDGKNSVRKYILEPDAFWKYTLVVVVVMIYTFSISSKKAACCWVTKKFERCLQGEVNVDTALWINHTLNCIRRFWYVVLHFSSSTLQLELHRVRGHHHPFVMLTSGSHVQNTKIVS